MAEIVSALGYYYCADHGGEEGVEGDLVDGDGEGGSGGGWMFEVESDHEEAGQSDNERILDSGVERDKEEEGAREDADEMAADDIGSLGGDAFGHCENDETCGSDGADEHHLLFAENEDDQGDCEDGQQALEQIVLPELPEFTRYGLPVSHVA